MSIDIDVVRGDTPTCSGQSFLDNAGSALAPKVVLDTVIEHLRLEASVGGYVAAVEQQQRIDAVSQSVATLIGTDTDHVALQSSATAAWMRAFSALKFREGDRILTTGSEYASNVLPMLQARRLHGVSVEFVPDGHDGACDPAALADMLNERVKLVAITHAASHNGLVVDTAAIGSVLREAGSDAWYFLDACQSIGQLPVDIGMIGADVVTATGRKWLRGPRGTGFLGLSDRALNDLDPSPIDMFGHTWDGELGYSSSSTAAKFQSFETSYAGVLGLGAAIDYALNIGIDTTTQRVNALAEYLRAALGDIDGIRVVDRGRTKSGIVVFTTQAPDSFRAAHQLREQGITVTAVGRATNPKDIASYGPGSALRASPHIYNTEADLDALAAALAAPHKKPAPSRWIS